jgi:hypothetical protein
MIGRFGAALALCAMPLQMGAAQAATPADQVAQVPLDQLCNMGGALGLSFGTTEHGVAASHKPGSINRDLPAEFGPFKTASVEASKYSRRFASVTYIAEFASKAEAMGAQKALVARLAANGWGLSSDAIDGGKPSAEAQLAASLAEGPVLYKGPPGGMEKNEGTMLTVSHFGQEVTVECMGLAESGRFMDEALGKMPEGTPKPFFTPVENMMQLNPADCDDPAKRIEFQKSLDRGSSLNVMPGADRVDYEERLADWKIMKLSSSGKIDREELVDKIIALIANPESVENIENAMGVLSSLDGIDPTDEAGMCRGLMKMFTQTSTMIAPKPGATGDAITPQWRETHELLDSEAKRLGVSFVD